MIVGGRWVLISFSKLNQSSTFLKIPVIRCKSLRRSTSLRPLPSTWTLSTYCMSNFDFLFSNLSFFFLLQPLRPPNCKLNKIYEKSSQIADHLFFLLASKCLQRVGSFYANLSHYISSPFHFTGSLNKELFVPWFAYIYFIMKATPSSLLYQ